MRKIYNNLLKMMFILAIPSLVYAAYPYATYPKDATYMNEYCATHSSSYAQQKCAKYFQGYWYENENYYYEGHYNDEEPYYPYYYPSSYYYYPENVIIEK